MAPSSNTSKAPKQSFFKEYFLYKLRSLKGFNITFLVMNLMITVVFALDVLISLNGFKNNALEISRSSYLYSILSYYVMGILYLTFIAENVLIMIMAAVNMKFCHNRSVMDTVGGLPLTIDQRFFGDFLSGFSSFSGTFFIGCIPALIMMAVIQFGIAPEYQAARIAKGSSSIYLYSAYEDKFLLVGFLALLTMFICLAASYTIACFVTSCSGKLNTSIIFTFGLAAALPIIAIAYAAFIVNSSIGVSNYTLFNVIGMLPPIGTIAHLFCSFEHSLLIDYRFPTASPEIIVMLAITILPAVGAYLISKKRKAEKVDKAFIYKPLYAAATFLLTVTAFGLVLYGLELPGLVVPVLIFTVAACIFIEYAGSHSKRTFWKGLVRFAVSAAVCTVFGVIVYNTNGFNIGKKLPDEKKIEYVFINGSYLTKNGYNPEIYNEPAIISAVYSEHKKIVDDLDKFSRVSTTSTWSRSEIDQLNIRYQMSDGSNIWRAYYAPDNETKKLLDNFSSALLEMPELFNRTTLGILDLPCESISYRHYKEDVIGPLMYMIKPSAQEEFIECLKTDLLNRPKDHKNISAGNPSYVYYNYIDVSGELKDQTIEIYDIDKNTLAFLSSGDNFVTEISMDVDDDTYFRVYYYADGINDDNDRDYTLYIGFCPDTPAERELISCFETEYTTADIFSDKFKIEADGKRLYVKPENEHAALTALIKLIKEEVSGGNIS